MNAAKRRNMLVSGEYGMLDWIKQALGSFSEIQNKNGYGQEILEPLAQDLARLKRRGDDMPAKALTFVVDGIGGDVPGLIRQADRKSVV